MARRQAAWLLSIPLMAIGLLLAHSLSYHLIAPGAHRRAELLERSGHAYLAYAPLFAAVCLALSLVALALRTVSALRGRREEALPAWPFGLLPPLAFVLQEHLERLVHSGGFPLSATLEPTFLVGLLLQLPLALAALLLARFLLAVADGLGDALPRRPRPGSEQPLLAAPALAPARPRIPVLALGHAGRAPPALI